MAARGAPLGRSAALSGGGRRWERSGADGNGAARSGADGSGAPRCASHERCSSALRRAAQLRSRILRREPGRAAPGPEEPSADRPARRRGGRCSGRTAAPPAPEETSLAEVSGAPPVRGTDPEEKALGGSNSPRAPPGSRNLSAQRGLRARAVSSAKDSTVKITLSRRGNTEETQVSRGSEIKSLDDLFSKAADVEDSTSISSDDFRQNILSLDDLASEISEAAELKLQGTDVQSSQESSKSPKKDTLLVEEEQTFPKMSAEIGAAEPSERDTEDMSAAEISEHLGEVSADLSGHRQGYPDHDDRSVNTEYSEDFEQSLSAAEAVSEVSEERSGSCRRSGKGPSSSASSPLLSRDGHQGLHTVAVKESAVQTVDPPFTYCCSKTHSSALLGPPAGSSYVDPVPIAHRVVSTDALEALTAYSPSVLALNAMLKQHLMLTQQFVENVQHLHMSLVESLENEKFHYHTLEEAKEYIRKHRAPPLTFEEVLEEMQKADEILLPS